jgi:hypothetical protein
MAQNIYKVYHLGGYMCSFFERDAALNWILMLVEEGMGDFGDYEILDRSDFPA